ncbi:MAG: hypothetical protein KC503_43040 [Myxococcales bacterium]|nr:hypothetical protein [Myxococcales bacterium]
MQHNGSIERIQRQLDGAVWIGGPRQSITPEPADTPAESPFGGDRASTTDDDEIPTAKRAKLEPRRLSSSQVTQTPSATSMPSRVPRRALRRSDTLLRLHLHQQMAREVLAVVGTREAHTTPPKTVIRRALAKTSPALIASLQAR